MEIKIGGQWFSSKDVPVMVVLTDEDKRNVGGMAPECDRYASAPAGHFKDAGEFRRWMDEGYRRGADGT